MAPIAAGLSLDEMRELARYYGGLQEPWSSPAPTSQASTLAIERGKAIASRGIPRQRVPACVACHGPGATRRNPIYPELAGQYADYLVLQLELFNKGQRGGSAYAHLMRPVATRLTHNRCATWRCTTPHCLPPSITRRGRWISRVVGTLRAACFSRLTKACQYIPRIIASA